MGTDFGPISPSFPLRETNDAPRLFALRHFIVCDLLTPSWNASHTLHRARCATWLPTHNNIHWFEEKKKICACKRGLFNTHPKCISFQASVLLMLRLCPSHTHPEVVHDSKDVLSFLYINQSSLVVGRPSWTTGVFPLVLAWFGIVQCKRAQASYIESMQDYGKPQGGNLLMDPTLMGCWWFHQTETEAQPHSQRVANLWILHP